MLGSSHTHNILQKWLAPTIVLNVSLQNYNTFLKHCSKFGTFLFYFNVFILFFWTIYVFWEKEKIKIIQTEKGQMVTIVHFVS